MVSGRPSFQVPEILRDLWTRELSLIPTYYGRMVFLAGLRNPDTGQYEYYGCPDHTSTISVSQGLKRIHEEIFREWVSQPLERKKADIEFYLEGLEIDPADLVDAWLRLTPYKNLVPGSIQGPERQKHISDIEAILGLLKNVYGVSSPDQDA
ncbi:MAG: hypothetical protein JO340_15755 [Acidobacteriaceae bacterium]|nr:hypothetical protein [Acidobacteriaceae bacterium]